MADERVVSEIVSQFLLNTCRLRPRLNDHAVQAAGRCAYVAALPGDDVEADLIPLTTGSVAEFYIEPMLPHFGDIDVMHYHRSRLAIPRGHPPPIQLPAEFHNYVHVYEIIDSHLPGYVYLKTRYLLSYCPEDEKYNCVEYDETVYFGIGEVMGSFHRPAVITVFSDPSMLSVDSVLCVRCLSWPQQATDWPTRRRNYDWPDSATVDHVVNSGCDVVHVAHRQCRRHEWMGKRQSRLSFSRAEIVLINSWTQVQQIVYHVLRVFMKTERLTEIADNNGTNILSNYLIKTLMLWTSELKPSSWWVDGLNLVKICVKLLHTLSVWLNDRRCQHYFVNDCNLIDNRLNMGMVAAQLMSTDETYLSLWFVENYILKCTQCCTKVVNIGMNLQNAIAAVVDWRNARLMHDSWLAQRRAEFNITALWEPQTLRYCICLKNELAKVDARLAVYCTAVLLLHVAWIISKNGFSDELVEVVTSILGQFVDIPRSYNQRSSACSLSKAAKLMKLAANKSRSTVQLIEIELSKAYLHRALRCKDSDSDSIYCLANVCLAVLYYTTGQYQTAIDHRTLVTRSQDHSQCSSHVVQLELLPQIDNNIDHALGLTVFYQYILSAALNHPQQTLYFTVFTTELFAYYLNIKFRSVMKYPLQTLSCDTGILQRYVKCISEIHHPFLSDMILHKSAISALKSTVFSTMELANCGRLDRLATSAETGMDLSQLLQQYAVEHLTTYRQLTAEHFGSVLAIVTTDFEALYAYKRGNYQRCLLLSIENVQTLWYADSLRDVLILPNFIELFDDDIVSLTALTLIVDRECRKSPANTSISQMTLSLYLMTQCQLKLRHSLTSLAKTLGYVVVAQKRHLVHRTLDKLTLTLAERKILLYSTN